MVTSQRTSAAIPCSLVFAICVKIMVMPTSLKDLVQKVGADCQQQELSGTLKNITILQRYLRTKFSHEVIILLHCSVF